MGVHILITAAEGRPLKEDADYSFDQARIVIGRSPSADIRIPHLTVSETHATLHDDGGDCSIVDNHSTNGTFVNGTRLVPERSRRLKDGDTIDVGAYRLSFHCGVALMSQTTTERTAELARRLFRRSVDGERLGSPRIVVLNGADMGRSVEIPAPPSRLLIGRAESCQLVLSDPRVSREHAELFRDLDGVMIRNMSAKNGLEINDQLTSQKRLRDGDELAIGTTRLLFEDPADEPMEALMADSDQRVAPNAERAEPKVEAPAPPAPAPKPVAAPKRTPLSATDIVLYGLASVVIILSIAGLIALLQ